MSIVYLVLVLATGTAVIPQSDTVKCEFNKSKAILEGARKTHGVIEAYCVGGVK